MRYWLLRDKVWRLKADTAPKLATPYVWQREKLSKPLSHHALAPARKVSELCVSRARVLVSIYPL